MFRVAVVWAFERDEVGSYLPSESPWSSHRHFLVLRSCMSLKKTILPFVLQSGRRVLFGGVSGTSMDGILLVHLHRWCTGR